jgi:hypothetical protein
MGELAWQVATWTAEGQLNMSRAREAYGPISTIRTLMGRVKARAAVWGDVEEVDEVVQTVTAQLHALHNDLTYECRLANVRMYAAPRIVDTTTDPV